MPSLPIISAANPRRHIKYIMHFDLRLGYAVWCGEVTTEAYACFLKFNYSNSISSLTPRPHQHVAWDFSSDHSTCQPWSQKSLASVQRSPVVVCRCLCCYTRFRALGAQGSRRRMHVTGQQWCVTRTKDIATEESRGESDSLSAVGMRRHLFATQVAKHSMLSRNSAQSQAKRSKVAEHDTELRRIVWLSENGRAHWRLPQPLLDCSWPLGLMPLLSQSSHPTTQRSMWCFRCRLGL